MKTTQCTKCNYNTVSVERVDLGLTTCIECAKHVKKVKGYMSYQHKTAPVVQIVTDEGWDKYREYAPYGKYTGRGSGVHRMSRPIKTK